jgi:drug/metabolite transporter (DMT)-like permease
MAITDRSIGAVLGDIAQHIQGIVKAELRLAKTEVRQELVTAGSAGVLVVAGGVGALIAVVFCLLAAVYALSTVIPSWAAALCVAFAVGIVAAAIIAGGLKRIAAIRVAPTTVSTVRENVEWAKQQAK